MSYRPDGGFETSIAVNNVRRGPLRFEEGVATDTDIPNDFGQGAYGDTQGAFPVTVVKDPATTMRERVHVGSASWIEAPTMLSDFVIGASANGPGFEMELGSSARLVRINPAQVQD